MLLPLQEKAVVEKEFLRKMGKVHHIHTLVD